MVKPIIWYLMICDLFDTKIEIYKQYLQINIESHKCHNYPICDPINWPQHSFCYNESIMNFYFMLHQSYWNASFATRITALWTSTNTFWELFKPTYQGHFTNLQFFCLRDARHTLWSFTEHSLVIKIESPPPFVLKIEFFLLALTQWQI